MAVSAHWASELESFASAKAMVLQSSTQNHLISKAWVACFKNTCFICFLSISKETQERTISFSALSNYALYIPWLFLSDALLLKPLHFDSMFAKLSDHISAIYQRNSGLYISLLWYNWNLTLHNASLSRLFWPSQEWPGLTHAVCVCCAVPKFTFFNRMLCELSSQIIRMSMQRWLKYLSSGTYISRSPGSATRFSRPAFSNSIWSLLWLSLLAALLQIPTEPGDFLGTSEAYLLKKYRVLCAMAQYSLFLKHIKPQITSQKAFSRLFFSKIRSGAAR